MIVSGRKLLNVIFYGFLIIFCPGVQAQQKPLRLWYDSPAIYWQGCVPLGNGHLGAMPDGGVYKEKIVLNDITLWSGGKQDADKPDAYQYLPQIRQLLLDNKNIEAQRVMSKYFVCQGSGTGNGKGANVPYGSYQTLGDLNIQYQYDNNGDVNQPVNYIRQLLLDNAIATTAFKLGKTNYKREYFTSFNNDAIIVKLTADQLKKINFSLAFTRTERFNVKDSANELQLYGQLNNGTDGKGMQYMVRLSIKHDGGKVIFAHDSLQVKDANTAIIYIAAGTDYKNANYLKTTHNNLTNALKTSYIQEKADHIKKFQKLFKRASLSLGEVSKDYLTTDKRLDAFTRDKSDNGLPVLYFQYGRYLMICSTKPGLLPPNLQGLWANTIETPWNGDYHLDINIQMNHWPLEVTNLGALNNPFFNLVQGLVEPGQKTAKAYYNANGWVAHVVTNIWGYTSPGEDYSWGAFNSGSAWLCQMLWSHYDFTHDAFYLRKLYPILKGSSAFYLSTLVKEPVHGWLVTAPSNSPENAFILPGGQHANVCIGPTIDNQLIRNLFAVTIASCKLLKIDEEFKQQLQTAIRLLPPDQIGKDGRLMEWLQEYKEAEIHHRHVSHLWGVYPGSEITMSTPELATAAKNSLITRGDDGTGWSLAWKINLWARLHDGNHALKLLQTLLRPVTGNKVNMSNGGGSYMNLFCAHPPFQIDGNFGGTAGIAEMLLQSQGNYVEFLPALPDECKDGSFTGWRVRGGGEVSASWKGGKLSSVFLKATVVNNFKIKIPEGLTSVSLIKNGKRQVEHPDHYVLSLPMKKNESVQIIFN